jgi:hypothetical protein
MLHQLAVARLAVEVASPRTRLYDRNRKKDVEEYRSVLPLPVTITPSRLVTLG